MPLDLPEVDIQAELALAEKEAKLEEKTEVVEVSRETLPEEKAGDKDEKPEGGDEKTETTEKPEKKGDPTVALRLARKEAKELKEQLRRKELEDGQRYAALEKRMSDLQNPPAEKPAFENDPANYLKAEVDELKKTSTQTAQQQQQTQVLQQIKGRLTASESEFAKEHPDYAEAAQHLVNIMTANMEAFGVSEDQRAASLENEIYQLTARALRAGKEPAELIYILSTNHGFKGKAEGKESADKLEKIAKGQEAAGTLGSGGRADAGKLTLDSLAKMDDDDFNALILDEKKWAQIGHLMH